MYIKLGGLFLYQFLTWCFFEKSVKIFLSVGLGCFLLLLGLFFPFGVYGLVWDHFGSGFDSELRFSQGLFG